MSYQNLIIWKRSIEIAEKIYKITESFPSNEKFGMISQMRRSAVSVSSNIAEGYGRMSSKYFVSFLKFSLGSLSELETQIILSERIKLTNKSFDDTKGLIIEVRKMLISLINKKK